MADTITWQPYCGAEYNPQRVAGFPVLCDLPMHGPDVAHQESETGFRWW